MLHGTQHPKHSSPFFSPSGLKFAAKDPDFQGFFLPPRFQRKKPQGRLSVYNSFVDQPLPFFLHVAAHPYVSLKTFLFFLRSTPNFPCLCRRSSLPPLNGIRNSPPEFGHRIALA